MNKIIQNLKTTNELLFFICNKNNISLGTLLNDNGACIQDVIDNNNFLIDSGGWTSVDGICRRKSKAIYPAEFKHNVVLQMLAGKSIQSLAIELNISNAGLLSQWLKAYQTHGIIGLHPKPKGRKSVSKTSKANQVSKPDEQKSQAELIAELQYLRMENDVLKKLEALERQQRKSKSSQTKSP